MTTISDYFEYNDIRIHYKRIGNGAHNVLFTGGALSGLTLDC